MKREDIEDDLLALMEKPIDLIKEIGKEAIPRDTKDIDDAFLGRENAKFASYQIGDKEPVVMPYERDEPIGGKGGAGSSSGGQQPYKKNPPGFGNMIESPCEGGTCASLNDEVHGAKHSVCKKHETLYGENPPASWEDTLNKIWSRAHIPEFANDAKTAITGLITRIAQKERQAGRDAAVDYIIKNKEYCDIAPEILERARNEKKV